MNSILHDAPLKQCKSCQMWYPATRAYFHKKASNRDKLQKKCKKCCGSSRLGLFHGYAANGIKQCTKCLQLFPATADYFQKHSDGGLQPRCKTCRSEDHALYYLDHVVETSIRSKRYREKNREKVSSHRRMYWVACGKEIEIRRKARLEANPDQKAKRVKQNSETYYRNREKYYARGNKRRARLAKVPGSHTAAQIAEQLKRQHYHCYYAACGFSKFPRVRENGKWVYKYHIEHTFPISRVVGTDIPANDMSYLVLSCNHCNSSKGNKFPWEWFEGGRLL